jgi:molybdopterin converting factor small subunit
MAIVFHIPGPLLSLKDGHRRIEIDGAPATVREGLDILFALYPGIRDRVLTEQNQIREHVNLFVGNEELRYLDGIITRIADGVEITIMQAVSGGSMLQILVRARP